MRELAAGSDWKGGPTAGRNRDPRPRRRANVGQAGSNRTGPDPLSMAMIEAAVKRHGARIVSAAGEGTEDDDPSSILMRRMIDAFAEYEKLIIGARTKSGRPRSDDAARRPAGWFRTASSRDRTRSARMAR